MKEESLKGMSRRSFLAKATMGTMGAAALAALGGYGSYGFADEENANETATASLFEAGSYSSEQSTPFATIEVACDFSESALTNVSYTPICTSDGDYFPLFEEGLVQYCDAIVSNGKPEGVDAVTGATLCSTAIEEGVYSCMLEALAAVLPALKPINGQVEDYKTFDSGCDQVFSPIVLGTMELPNRCIKSAGSGQWADSNQDKVTVGCELYGCMADNGVSLILLPGGAMANSAIIPGKAQQEQPDDEAAVAPIRPLVDRVHEGGGKIGFQLCFGGAAPAVPDSVINETPVEELDAFIENEVATAARRGQLAGFDCIEIKGASADALNGFLTRRVNKREDDYGPQSIESRTLLFRRMIEKIKEVNGADFPVGALINGVEENDAVLGDNDGFTTVEESQQIAKALVDAGADWIQVRVGANGQEMNIWAPDVQHIVRDADGITGYGALFDYGVHFGGLVDGSRSGFASFLPLVKKIKEVVDVPVGCAAYMDLRLGPDYLNAAIENGDLDLVFMNRPLNCDPELVAKMQEGRREDVTPCMKCMHCHDGIGSGGLVSSSCRMNAASFNSLTDTMPEGQVPMPAEASRNVLVVGAGPAGLEAARVAAERGHSVELYDSATRLGGLTNFARGVKGNHENFTDFVAYYEHQLEKLGVNVNLGTEVTLDLAKEQNPDVVVVATGGLRQPRFEGATVFSPEEAFGSKSLGENVAIIGGNVQAVDFAAYLVTLGKKVAILNPGPKATFDKGQSGWFRTYLIPYLSSRGTTILNSVTVDSVDETGVIVTTEFGGQKEILCDSVIDFSDMAPNTALADELTNAAFEVYTVGDCAEPYNIQKAILTGNLCARAL